jgi:hypothetical protein
MDADEVAAAFAASQTVEIDIAVVASPDVPCVDGSGLARGIFTSQDLVGAAMCSAC